MRYFAYFFILIIASSGLNAQSQSEAEVLLLEEAIALAIENNHQIQISRYDAEISALGANPALVGRGPKIDFGGSYQFGWSDASIETLPFGPPGDGNNTNELEGISHTISLGPEMTLLLYDGQTSKWQLDQLHTSSEIADLRLQQALESTVSQVLQTYIELAFQQSLLEISEQNIELSQDRLARSGANADYGTSNSLESLQVTVDLKTDSVAYRSQVLAYENARRSLNYLLALPMDKSYRVEAELALRENLALEELRNSLVEKNTLLRLSQKELMVAEAGVALSKAAYRPQVQGFANVNYTYIQNEASFLLTQRTFGPNAGIRLNIPIADGGARRVQKEQAQLAYQRQQLSQQDLEEELTKDLHNAYAAFSHTQEQLRIEESNLVSFERNLENLQNQFKLGLVNNTDIRTAQLLLNAAKNRISNFQYTLKQSELSLLLLAGELINEN